MIGIVLAWFIYLVSMFALTVNWLVLTPLVIGSLEAFNTSAHGMSGISEAGLVKMRQLTMIFGFSWNWVFVIALIGLFLWVLTFHQRTEAGGVRGRY